MRGNGHGLYDPIWFATNAGPVCSLARDSPFENICRPILIVTLGLRPFGFSLFMQSDACWFISVAFNIWEPHPFQT